MISVRPASQPVARDRQWYVVRAKARKEDFAVQQLERRGVAVFLPRIVEWGREEISALFPGYRFVWAPGVRSFVAFGRMPTPVPDAVIRFIAASASADGIIRPLAPFKPGDRVQIRSGP